ncbi:MAG: NAD(+) synthase, partial [Treponema sp.]|nr:NAD(+) synthase [Treponema sp.]
MAHGFFRVASSSPDIIVADCTHNATEIINAVKEASKNEVSLIVFPELSLTGSTCGDLFLQKTLQKSAIEQTLRIANECKNLPILIAVGIPFLHGNLLYNCAALLFKGKIIALIPKTYISTKISSNESHYFASLKNNSSNCTNEILLVNFSNENPYVPFSPNIIISSSKNENISIAIEIGNDLFAPIPPSTFSALNGAAIIANLSATNQTPGMCEHRKKIIESHSSLTMCAYIYTDCSKTESTQDEVFSGHKIIAELGDIL